MIEHLYAALASPLGIVLDTDDVERLRQKLYTIRRDLKDPQLDTLSFIPSPTNSGQLWLVKRQADGTPEKPPAD